MTSAAEKFMQAESVNAEALLWLKDAPQDNAPAWVRALRETGAESFAQTGLPKPKQEGWQYTNLRPLTPAKFTYSAAPVIVDAAVLPAPLVEDSWRLVLVNGQMQKNLSRLPPGVTVETFAETKGLEEYLASVGDLAEFPMKALNTAFVRDGLVLKFKGDIDKPVEVLFYSLDGTASYPRLLYYLEENAGLTLVERHAGVGCYFANSYADIVQMPSSRLKFHRFVDGNRQGYPFCFTSLRMLKDSHFEGFSLAAATPLARQEFQMKLLDQGISAIVRGIYLMSGSQSHDFTVLADHFDEGGKSAQHFKGVIDDQARAVFQGKIHVRRSAQKTDGYQSHHALLLSKDAEACAKPELEIYADDVKCSHGATSGFMDEAALFYLRSRGIPHDEAKALLINSFLNEVIDELDDPQMRFVYQEITAAWLKGRGA